MVPIGIEEKPQPSTSFLVFPNPSVGTYNIKIDDADIKNATISVFDVLGKLVYTESNTNLTAGHLKTIDISNAIKGMYFIVVRSEFISKTMRIIKQ